MPKPLKVSVRLDGLSITRLMPFLYLYKYTTIIDVCQSIIAARIISLYLSSNIFEIVLIVGF